MQSTIPEVHVTIPQRYCGRCSQAMRFLGKHGGLSIATHDVRGTAREKVRNGDQQVHVRSCDERGEPQPRIKCFLCQR